MIYISAQPAELYFLWQLEVQLSNFEEIGIPAESVHILFSFDIALGIPPEIENFTTTNNQAKFYFYPDTRITPIYISSIRPHILKKHFKKHPFLRKENIFYHDCDILFRERINEAMLSSSSSWYISDTREYISSDYLKKFGQDFFIGLCNHINISPNLVEKNKENSGGAQYIMKNIDHLFWEEIEMESEKIFNYINWFYATTDQLLEPQAWCADMWAILWNAWKRKIDIQIHKELDFCWPMDDIDLYYKTKIFHNSGVKKNDSIDLFCKLHYREITPYSADHSKISKDKCSIVMVNAIRKIASKKGQEESRFETN